MKTPEQILEWIESTMKSLEEVGGKSNIHAVQFLILLKQFITEGEKNEGRKDI